MPSPLFDLTGKRALVTGASRGIGRALAVGLAAHGADVFCVARDAGALEETSKEAAAGSCARAEWRSSDLHSPGAVHDVVEDMVQRLGGVDILVNDAGSGHYTPVVETDPGVFREVVDLDLTVPYLLMREVGQHLLAQGSGKVVNVASILGVVGDRNQAAYVAAKTGLVGLTRAVALEWARSGVQVNALAPGFVVTDMTSGSYSNPRSRDYIEQRIPMGRWGVPSDLVGATVFLCSPASDFMTGQVIAVDGGWLAQ